MIVKGCSARAWKLFPTSFFLNYRLIPNRIKRTSGGVAWESNPWASVINDSAIASQADKADVSTLFAERWLFVIVNSTRFTSCNLCHQLSSISSLKGTPIAVEQFLSPVKPLFLSHFQERQEIRRVIEKILP